MPSRVFIRYHLDNGIYTSLSDFAPPGHLNKMAEDSLRLKELES